MERCGGAGESRRLADGEFGILRSRSWRDGKVDVMIKYLKMIGAWIGCAVVVLLAVQVLIAGLVFVAFKYEDYKMEQLMEGKAGYSVSKQTDLQTGKERIHIVCDFFPYPARFSDEELEDTVIKTVVRIRKEHPEADVIDLKGQSEGFMDVDECRGMYRKEKPNEMAFVNYGWTKLKKIKYEKVLLLPPE